MPKGIPWAKDVKSKPCSKCGQVLPLSSFNQDRGRYKSRCRKCTKLYYNAKIEHQRELSRNWYANNTEIAQNHAREWKASNRERIKQARARYHQNNGENSRAKAREWKLANADHIKCVAKINRAIRRARERHADGKFSASEWSNLKEQYKHTCLCCGEIEPYITLTPDHIVPLSLGGANTINNIQPLCMNCNRIKNARIIDYRGRSL